MRRDGRSGETGKEDGGQRSQVRGEDRQGHLEGFLKVLKWVKQISRVQVNYSLYFD
jgi:hypothetical protein